jgi:hypothetical protein
MGAAIQVRVRIDANLPWRYTIGRGGNYVAVCDPLKLTLQAESWDELMEDTSDVLNSIFHDLLRANELDRFLRDHGWAAFQTARRMCGSKCHFALLLKWRVLMVLRDTFINKIRDLNYTLNNETKRVHIFRKKGGTHYITVKKTDKLEDEYVRSSLQQAGLSQKEADTFIAQHRI